MDWQLIISFIGSWLIGFMTAFIFCIAVANSDLLSVRLNPGHSANKSK